MSGVFRNFGGPVRGVCIYFRRSYASANHADCSGVKCWARTAMDGRHTRQFLLLQAPPKKKTKKELPRESFYKSQNKNGMKKQILVIIHLHFLFVCCINFVINYISKQSHCLECFKQKNKHAELIELGILKFNSYSCSSTVSVMCNSYLHYV